MLYTTGEFAQMANVSIRTIRFYDEKEVLKPSKVNNNGKRFYTDKDFAKLQQILLFKYLGFSLQEIKQFTIQGVGNEVILNQLDLQSKMIQDKIEQLQLVEKAISETKEAISVSSKIDWNNMLKIIQLTDMEDSLKRQYRDAQNLNARVQLHKKYSINKQGWFPWVYSKCDIRENMDILEVGCGNGALWLENINILPSNVSFYLSDASEGMIRDVKRNFELYSNFEFSTFYANEMPFPSDKFDRVVANHMLFYCDNIQETINEIYRVLNNGGKLICSTYGKYHMKEVTDLVQKFDKRIVLSSDMLFERFGIENGKNFLGLFSNVDLQMFNDELVVTQSEPLIEYILSCHGNQNKYILNRYNEFKSFVEKEVRAGYHITKQSGVFICEK